MYLYLNPFKTIGTDRLNLHDFSIDWKASVEGEADAYGGGIVDVWFLHLIALYRAVSLSMSLTLSINAAHLNQHSSPVKRRKAEEGRIITLE
jgi:hypothetical protein